MRTLLGVEIQTFKEQGQSPWRKRVVLKPVNEDARQQPYQSISRLTQRVIPRRTEVIDPDDNEPGRPKTRIYF